MERRGAGACVGEARLRPNVSIWRLYPHVAHKTLGGCCVVAVIHSQSDFGIREDIAVGPEACSDLYRSLPGW